MSGEKYLRKLLANLRPRLGGQFIFCSVPDELVEEFPMAPIGMFREREGTTLVIEKEAAEQAGLSGPLYRLITLDVHSSLEAVGLIAAVSGALAGAGISANVFAGFYHDHLLVPAAKAEAAMSVLTELSERYAGLD